MNKLDFTKIGFDYGVKPFIVVAPDLEVSDLFFKANCIGIGYIFKKSNEREMIPVQIALVFQNEEPADRFFNILHGWVEKTDNDGDAVIIEFIANKKGGYTIAIALDNSKCIERMIPKYLKDKVTPIVFTQTVFKEFDIGENYLNFRANINNAEKIAVGYLIGTPTNIIKQSQKYISKKIFNFQEEGKIPSDSISFGYNTTKELKDFSDKKLHEPTNEITEEISKRRILEIKTLLPLTYSKIINHWLEEMINILSLKFNFEIITQAICNLTIFERLKQIDDLSQDFTKTGYTNRILDYLLTTFESFDSYYPEDDFYTKERIINQINNDKSELETYLNR